jgi:hypothetical protein
MTFDILLIDRDEQRSLFTRRAIESSVPMRAAQRLPQSPIFLGREQHDIVAAVTGHYHRFTIRSAP